ncbi:hypothetical protein [Pseudoponticoccus marisrubri]|uniref:Uncharacterized protein n=1 Tax=Pseudoponticoccus marisrubri TaxID=1685382 RepID=A0A0W7WDY4_9RHOB|nr:hypothetical protein [Pseudoponticoccus marisrubri]KUF08794.1 hypothetical protein AVJ23_20975 [Pseudoponticoccus marisrubri]
MTRRADGPLGGLAACAALVLALPVSAQQERPRAHFLGPGATPCATILGQIAAGQEDVKNGTVGYIIGAWSQATVSRRQAFDDLVNRLGTTRLVQLTFDACQTAPEGTLLGEVVSGSIAKTTAGLGAR